MCPVSEDAAIASQAATRDCSSELLLGLGFHPVSANTSSTSAGSEPARSRRPDIDADRVPSLSESTAENAGPSARQ